MKQADQPVHDERREDIPGSDPDDVTVDDGLELLQPVRASVEDQDGRGHGKYIEDPDKRLDVHVFCGPF